MNKQQWQRRINTLERELAELKANPPKREPGEQWKPEKGERYWFACKDGSILQRWWGDNVVENETFNNFNVFETEEEAKFARERTKVMRELDTWATDYSPSMGGVCYSISFSFKSNTVCPCLNYSFIKSHVFETEEIAQKAIQAIGEDRLKKYYFKVVE